MSTGIYKNTPEAFGKLGVQEFEYLKIEFENIKA